MKINIKILLLICLLVVSSCTKQSVPDIASDQNRTIRDVDQLKACSDVTFYEGFLYRKNLVNLFVCTSWDLKFVEMFRALEETRDQDWNDLIAPIDSIFFGDRERRDRFISYYQQLDNDGALDDLGRVITSLTETNFYDGLNALFVCAENPAEESCKGRNVIVTKAELKNLLLLFSREPEILIELSRIVDGFGESLGPDSEELRRSINKFNQTSFFKKLRVLIITKFAEKYLEGLGDSDLSLINKFFATKETGTDHNWINSWIKRSDVSGDYITKTFSLPVKKYPEMVRDFKVLNQLYKSENVCEDESLQLSIDIKSLVENTVTHLKKNDVVRFFDTLLLANESVVYAKPICPGLTNATRVINYYEYSSQRNINHSIDLNNVLSYSIELLAKNPTIDIVRFILSLTEYNHSYFVDVLNSNLFNVSNEMNRVVLENSKDFYNILIKVLKRSDESNFDSIAFILNNLFDRSLSPDLAAWSKSWTFWNDKERNFLFDFVDTHLESDTDFIRLFSFYSLSLKDISSDWSKIGEYYNKDDETQERTYQALKNILAKFQGEAILSDYRRFFSREHFLELLKVVTSGENFEQMSLKKLSIRNVDNKKITYYPSVEFHSTAEFNGEQVTECARSISESKNLSEMLRNYPESCNGLNQSYALDNISRGLGASLNEYSRHYPEDVTDHFFEVGGLLSPETSLWLVSTMVSIESKYKKEEYGIEYLMGTIKKYFIDIGLEKSRGVTILKDVLVFVSDWIGGDNESTIRSGAISELVRNKDKADALYRFAPSLIKDFDLWNKNYTPPSYLLDRRYTCSNFLNVHVGRHICPEPEKIKSNVNSLVKQLVTRHEASEGIPIEYILKAALPGSGVRIPLGGSSTKLKRLTLLETLNSLYDLSDKSLAVNREKVKYRSSLSASKEKYTMTTSERIDHVIRNVTFGYNYLGVQYLNAVVKGYDYNETVKEKQRLMGICLNTPGVRCGKPMSKDERRIGRNAFWAYDGLVDVNNGNGLEPRMKYGEYMQAFMYSFVASSALEAQEVKLFPLEDYVLKKHNGRALGYFSEIAAFSNLGRFVHDRVGRTRGDFLSFINSPEFMRVNDMILSRVSENNLTIVAEELLTTIQSNQQDIVSDIVDWINSLSYTELRMTEDLIAKSIYVSTYLGSKKQVLGYGDNEDFSSNTSFESIYIMNELMKEYKTLKKSFRSGLYIRKIVSPALNVVSFLYEKLRSTESREQYWFILNSGYGVFKELLYTRGAITSLVDNIIKKNKASTIYEIVVNSYEYFKQLEKADVSDLSKSIEVTYSASVGLDTVWDYLDSTTFKRVCSLEGEACEVNKHYDQPAKIGYVLSRGSNLEDILNWFLIDNKKEIINTSNDFLPFLKLIK